MKLRNCFFTAVFFSVGITFALAEEPVDEDTFRETTYTFNNSTAANSLNADALTFWKSAGSEADNSTLFESNRIAGNGNGGNDYTIGYRNDVQSPSGHEVSTTAAPAGNESLRVYDFSKSFYDSVTEDIGFTARSDLDNPLDFSEVFVEAPTNTPLPTQETFSLLAFDRKVFTSAHNWGQILSGGYYYEEEEENAFFQFSSMITIPFTILVITLALGFLLVLHTSSSGNRTNV